MLGKPPDIFDKIWLMSFGALIFVWLCAMIYWEFNGHWIPK